MFGAIAGDVIGSVHEGMGTKTKDFPLFDECSCFTDDTILTLAVASVVLNGGDYIDAFHHFFHLYPECGFGGSCEGSLLLSWRTNRPGKHCNRPHLCMKPTCGSLAARILNHGIVGDISSQLPPSRSAES